MTTIAAIVTLVAAVTARAERERLSALGLAGPALELALGVGAAKRHASRVEAAIFAAIAWALVWNEDEGDAAPYLARAREAARAMATLSAPQEDADTILDAWAVLATDAHGVGGHRDTEGIATARHPGLDALGTGRKQAGDGPAWTAAISGAREALETALADRGFRELRLAPDPSGESGVIGVAWRRPDGGAGWQGATPIHPRWAAAVAGGRILAAASGEDLPAAELAAWGRVYNRARLAHGPDAEPWVAAIMAAPGGALAGRLWASSALDGPEESRLPAWLEALGEEEALACARLWADAGAPLPAPVVVLHGDHGIPAGLILWGAYQAPPGEFSVRTRTLPGLRALCGLHGPAMGDDPVPEEEVRYEQRTPDRPPSRLVDRAPRADDRVTLVVDRTQGDPWVITAYAGPAAPREPGDPSLPPEGPEREESARFWAEHALSA